MRTFVQKTVQTLALAGLAIAVAMSMLLGAKFYAHGALTAFEEFIPNAFAYFLWYCIAEPECASRLLCCFFSLFLRL